MCVCVCVSKRCSRLPAKGNTIGIIKALGYSWSCYPYRYYSQYVLDTSTNMMLFLLTDELLDR